jgi:basic amino acid/polyamine antiporter, APA family
MNVSVLGVIPWREFRGADEPNARSSVISVFMQQIYGGWAGKAVTVLIIWTAFGSVFSLLLGYSRVPLRCGAGRQLFRGLRQAASEEPLSLRFVAGAGRGGHGFLRAATCRRDRRAGGDSHSAAIPAAAVGLVSFLRKRNPEMPRPFRMWLYPLPALLCHRRVSSTF